MSDEEITEPEAAALRARMEEGDLPRECLTLADFLGHLPSRRALGRGDTSPEAEELAATPTLEFWGRRLGRWGPPIILRVGVALARATAAQTEPEPAIAENLQRGLSVAERFLARAAGGESDEALGERVDAAAKDVARAALTLDPEDSVRRACQTLLPVLRAMLDVLSGGAPDRMLLDSHYVRVLEQATATGLPTADMKDAAAAELLPWILG